MKSNKANDTAEGLHPWVRQAQASLGKASPGMYGILLRPGLDRLNVEVSKEAIPRSMLIWDRLLKAMESSSFDVKIANDNTGRTVVTVDGEPLSIRLRETVSRSEHVPTAAEKERMERLNLTHVGPTWDYRPSGRLVLTIDHVNCHNQTLTEVTWSDTNKKRIEDRLDSFADMLEKVVKEMKRRWALAKERNRIWEDEVRQRQEAARLQAEEKIRCEQLEKQASAWSLVCAVRGFINAVRDEVTSGSGAIEPGSPMDHWLQWAERHAASIDPVKSVIADPTSKATAPGEAP